MSQLPLPICENYIPRPQSPGFEPTNCAHAIPLAELPTVELMGLKLHAITQGQCVETIVQELHAGRGGCVITPNLDHLRRCRQDLRYACTVRQAELRVADGMPLVWASRIKGTPLPERVAGSDLIFSLSAALGRNDFSAYLLGGAPGTAEKAAARLTELYNGLRIVGTRCPPLGFEQNQAELRAIAHSIRLARPAVVFVALGSPKQENLIRRLRRGMPHTWWVGVGVTFSFVCGDVRRAPRWMQRTGVEWLHRLIQEPKRLWKRYLVQGLPFAGALMLSTFRDRIFTSSKPRMKPVLEKRPS
jgi:N-acetylglucosaminyldiphosphoundecaprenol N-acetyl-beta-D-mannosaminyltransferase